MITVKVEDYCQRCPYFEPKVVKLYQGDIAAEIVIRCADKQKCRLSRKAACGNTILRYCIIEGAAMGRYYR